MGWSTEYDWASPNTLRNKAKYGILADLSAALIERSSVIENFGYSEEVKKNTPGWIPVANGISFHVSTRSIDSVIGDDGFLSQFADHTIDDGDYTGLTGVPTWTLAKLNTAIGYDKPGISWRNNQVTAEWVWWVYSAINLLLFTVNFEGLLMSRRTRSSGGGHISWGAAVAAWNAASWTAWNAYSSGSWEAIHTAAYSPTPFPQYGTLRTAFRLDTITAPTSLSYKADVYLKFGNGFISSTVYENNDYPGATDETFGRIFTDASTRTGDIPQGLVEMGNFDVITATNPTGVSRAYYTPGNFFAFPVIRKYDVVDGFDFVAP